MPKTAQEIAENLTEAQDSQLYNDVWYDKERAEGWQLDDDSGDIQWAIDLGLVEESSGLLTNLGEDVAGIVREEDMGRRFL